MYVFVPIFPQINAIENCQLRRAYLSRMRKLMFNLSSLNIILKNKKTSNQVKVCKLLKYHKKSTSVHRCLFYLCCYPEALYMDT